MPGFAHRPVSEETASRHSLTLPLAASRSYRMTAYIASYAVNRGISYYLCAAVAHKALTHAAWCEH